jgi:hypothetical protein
MQGYTEAGLMLNVQANTDLKNLETDVRAIKNQGERKIVNGRGGSQIELYKNLTRYYKA